MIRHASQSVCIVGGLLTLCATALGQTTFNEREVKSLPSTLDKLDVWGMDIRFKDPRIIKIKQAYTAPKP